MISKKKSRKKSLFIAETWNMYCERQRKLRAEYGTQKEVNRAIMNSVNLNVSTPQPPQMTIMSSGGRQLVNLVGPGVFLFYK